MRRAPLLALIGVFALAGCSRGVEALSCPADEIRDAINAEIQQGVKATTDKDIDAYMDGIPDDFRIFEDDGSVTDKDAMRDFALKSWAIIDRTITLDITLDRLEIAPGCAAATAYTSQRWERIMRRPDNSGADNVVTTQKHEEAWRKTGGRWLNYGIKELGGEFFVNGEPYEP